MHTKIHIHTASTHRWHTDTDLIRVASRLHGPYAHKGSSSSEVTTHTQGAQTDSAVPGYSRVLTGTHGYSGALSGTLGYSRGLRPHRQRVPILQARVDDERVAATGRRRLAGTIAVNRVLILHLFM